MSVAANQQKASCFVACVATEYNRQPATFNSDSAQPYHIMESWTSKDPHYIWTDHVLTR